MYLEQYILEVLIRDSSRKNKLKKTYIVNEANKLMNQIEERTVSRNTIERHLDDMVTCVFKKDENADEFIKNKSKACIFCEGDEDGKKSNYWIENVIPDNELRYLLDCVLYSKILPTEKANDLCKRIVALSGENFKKYTMYINNMEKQLYIGEADVLKNVALIQEAIVKQKKIQFTLNVFKPIRDKAKIKVRMVPCDFKTRTCSPYDIIVSNGRYYLLASNMKSHQSGCYTIYRIDLMTEVRITRAVADSKRDVGLRDTDNLAKHRIENPYLFTGTVKPVRIRIDLNQFTQIVDWFGDNFDVLDVDEEKEYADIEIMVNQEAFVYWVLQYSQCVEVIGPDDFRKKIKSIYEKAAKKYSR